MQPHPKDCPAVNAAPWPTTATTATTAPPAPWTHSETPDGGAAGPCGANTPSAPGRSGRIGLAPPHQKLRLKKPRPRPPHRAPTPATSAVLCTHPVDGSISDSWDTWTGVSKWKNWPGAVSPVSGSSRGPTYFLRCGAEVTQEGRCEALRRRGRPARHPWA